MMRSVRQKFGQREMSETRKFILLVAVMLCAGVALTTALVAVQGWSDRQSLASHAHRARVAWDEQDRQRLAHLERAIVAVERDRDLAAGREAVCLVALGSHR